MNRLTLINLFETIIDGGSNNNRADRRDRDRR